MENKHDEKDLPYSQCRCTLVSSRWFELLIARRHACTYLLSTAMPRLEPSSGRRSTIADVLSEPVPITVRHSLRTDHHILVYKEEQRDEKNSFHNYRRYTVTGSKRVGDEINRRYALANLLSQTLHEQLRRTRQMKKTILSIVAVALSLTVFTSMTALPDGTPAPICYPKPCSNN